MNTGKLLTAMLCTALGLSISACSYDRTGGLRSSNPPPTQEPVAKIPPVGGTREAAPAAPPKTETAKPAPLGGSESSVVTMMLPASDKGTVYLEKAAPKEVLVGKEFDYKIRVTNSSASVLQGTTLTGKLPADFRVVGTGPEAQISGLNAKWDVGKMEPGESKTFVVRGVALKAGSLYGCSDLTFTVSSACVAIKVVEPALKLAKYAPSEVLLCDPIPIRIVVSNTGSGPASSVIVKETLPEGLLTADGKPEVAYDFKTLAAGESKEVTIQTRAAKIGEFACKASATGSDGLTASADSKTTVRQPVLEVVHEAPKIRYPGLPVVNTVTVTNKGDGIARNSTLVGMLPAKATFVEGTGGVKPDAGKLTWNLGNVAPNEAKKVTYTLKSDTLGDLECYSTVSADCAKASAKAVTSIKGVPGLLLEMVDVTDPIAIGEKETYVITITNQGTADGTNIVVTADIPDEQEFVTVEGDTKGKAEGRKVTFEAAKTLAPKAKLTFRVITKALKEADSRFKVSFTSDQTVEPVYKTESTHIYSDK